MILGFGAKQEPIPDHHKPISLTQLDNLLTVLRYWYGVEVDNWINSEASRYTVIMRIDHFKSSKDLKRLHDYFKEAVKEAESMQGSQDPIDFLDFQGTYADFIGVEVNAIKSLKGAKGGDILDIRRLIPACKIHYPVKNWFFFTDEKRYYPCQIKLTLSFEPFGEGGGKNSATIKLRILEDNVLAVTGFESAYRNFDQNFNFLFRGLDTLEEIDNRIAEKYSTGKRDIKASPRSIDWFLFECMSESEAIVLNGINQTLGIESYQKDKLVEFKMEEFDIPGLISYVRAGLPQYIFIPEDNKADE